MSGMKQWLCSRRVLWGLGLLVVLVACRLPWIKCDAGVPALWDYGHFCTDEGFYTYGGKCAYLTGRLVDPFILEPLTLTYAPLQHVLCYFAYECFGINGWVHRVPAFLAAILAWVVIYVVSSRRTTPWLAGLLVSILSCNPISLVYERTASTDVLMGSFAVIAFAFALKRSLSSAFFCAIAFALAYFAKPTAVGVAPLIVLTLLSCRPWRWPRLVLFICSLGVFLMAARFLLNQHLAAIARQEGLVASEFIRLMGRGLPTPALGDLLYHLKSISVFPRWTTAGVLGGGFIFTAFLPLAAAIGRLFKKRWRWDRRMALYLGLVLYSAALSCGNQFYVRYYAPMMFFIPLLFVEVRKDLPALSHVRGWQALLVLVLSFGVYESVFWLAPVGQRASQALVPYFCNHHNLPAENLWRISWVVILPSALVIVFMVGRVRGWKLAFSRQWFLAALLCLLMAHFGATGLPLFRFGFMAAQATQGVSTLLLMHALLLIFSMMWLVPYVRMRQWRVWFGCLGILLALSWLVGPHWRVGTQQLLARQWNTRNMEASLAAAMPTNAVILGDRSLSVFVGSRFLVGSLGAMSDQDMVKEMKRIIKQRPHAVYVILDQVQRLQWEVLRKNTADIKCQIVAKIVLPAYHTGEPMDCYVGRLECPNNP